jgi:hypothetical protein
MRRRRIGILGSALLAAAVLALPAAASDVERELPASEMDAAAETAVPPAAAQRGASTSAEASGAPVPTGSVARATFTTAVVDREPTDSIDTLANDQRQIHFFSELRGLQGQVVSHRWEYGGEWAAEILFEVGGPRWRVHSTKRLDPIETGTWSVSVVDASGRVLETASFEYTAASAGTAPRPQEAAAPPAAATQP